MRTNGTLEIQLPGFLSGKRGSSNLVAGTLPLLEKRELKQLVFVVLKRNKLSEKKRHYVQLTIGKQIGSCSECLNCVVAYKATN